MYIANALSTPVLYQFYDTRFVVREASAYPPPHPRVTLLPPETLFIPTIYNYLLKGGIIV